MKNLEIREELDSVQHQKDPPEVPWVKYIQYNSLSSVAGQCNDSAAFST